MEKMTSFFISILIGLFAVLAIMGMVHAYHTYKVEKAIKYRAKRKMNNTVFVVYLIRHRLNGSDSSSVYLSIEDYSVLHITLDLKTAQLLISSHIDDTYMPLLVEGDRYEIWEMETVDLGNCHYPAYRECVYARRHPGKTNQESSTKSDINFPLDKSF